MSKYSREPTKEEMISMPKFMCYYKLGDTIPYYIETMGWEKNVGRLKERILETRGRRGTAPDLFGVMNIDQFKIYPPGRGEDGKPIHPEMTDMHAPIPTHSTLEDPFIVPAVRDVAGDAAKAASVQDLVKQRMEAKRKAREAAKAAEKASAELSQKKEEEPPITVPGPCPE